MEMKLQTCRLADGNAVVNAVVPDENSEDFFVIW